MFHKGLSSVLGAKQNALHSLRQLSGRSKPFAFEENDILASPIETSDHSIFYLMPEIIFDNLFLDWGCCSMGKQDFLDAGIYLPLSIFISTEESG